jgi:hypothetical protein
MIDIKASQSTKNRYIRNICAVYTAATPEQRYQGMHWYHTAHALAAMLADSTDPLDTYQMAGAIAALSAQKSWSENKRLAADAAGGNIHGHTGSTLVKVTRILSGLDPAAILPKSLKTGHFFRCIADPEDPEAVVIDRHAHDVAVNKVFGNKDRGLSNVNRYAMLAKCYVEAAYRLTVTHKISILPSQVQAVTWVAWKEQKA